MQILLAEIMMIFLVNYQLTSLSSPKLNSQAYIRSACFGNDYLRSNLIVEFTNFCIQFIDCEYVRPVASVKKNMVFINITPIHCFFYHEKRN